jgi:hypothetical protein
MQDQGTTREQALAFFDGLPTVEPAQLLGLWRGSGLATGHPQDGLLETLGWFGKHFVDVDAVHPLLFGTEHDVVDVDSRWLQFGLDQITRPGIFLRTLFRWLRPLLRTRKPRARIRTVTYRGRASAAMVYDYLPIIDVFRLVDDQTILGVMDQRGQPQPFFFVLRRVA